MAHCRCGAFGFRKQVKQRKGMWALNPDNVVRIMKKEVSGTDGALLLCGAHLQLTGGVRGRKEGSLITIVMVLAKIKIVICEGGDLCSGGGGDFAH
jgi:hypothetical protein